MKNAVSETHQHSGRVAALNVSFVIVSAGTYRYIKGCHRKNVRSTAETFQWRDGSTVPNIVRPVVVIRRIVRIPARNGTSNEMINDLVPGVHIVVCTYLSRKPVK
jgi:hypothetical protein